MSEFSSMHCVRSPPSCGAGRPLPQLSASASTRQETSVTCCNGSTSASIANGKHGAFSLGPTFYNTPKPRWECSNWPQLVSPQGVETLRSLWQVGSQLVMPAMFPRLLPLPGTLATMQLPSDVKKCHSLTARTVLHWDPRLPKWLHCDSASFLVIYCSTLSVVK